METPAAPAPGPLAGIRILDLTRLLPGPLCTLYLADLGADVVKVEDPHRGDYARSIPPLQGRQSFFYNLINRNKRSIALDARTEEGLARLHQLVQQAHVLVESYRPGVAQGQGYGYEALKALNPSLVYCAITGYGQDGPLAAAAGHDLNYQALSGLLHQTGVQDGPLAIPGFQIADVAGGSLTAAMSILAAVVQQQRTGQGCAIDVNMTRAAFSHAAISWATAQAMGGSLPHGRDLLNGGMPFYSLYACKDGGYMAVGALEYKFWEGVCQALHTPHLLSRHIVFGEEAAQVRAELAAIFGTRTRDEWAAYFATKDCCVTPVLSPLEAAASPLAQAQGWVQLHTHPTDGPTAQVVFPAHITGWHWQLHHHAPSLGEHTDEVVKEWLG